MRKHLQTTKRTFFSGDTERCVFRLLCIHSQCVRAARVCYTKKPVAPTPYTHIVDQVLDLSIYLNDVLFGIICSSSIFRNAQHGPLTFIGIMTLPTPTKDHSQTTLILCPYLQSCRNARNTPYCHRTNSKRTHLKIHWVPPSSSFPDTNDLNKVPLKDFRPEGSSFTVRLLGAGCAPIKLRIKLIIGRSHTVPSLPLTANG